MAQKEKACQNCKTIYFGDKCPSCDSTQATETFKGRLHVFNHENSEIANRLKINKEGEFAIKLK